MGGIIAINIQDVTEEIFAEFNDPTKPHYQRYKLDEIQKMEILKMLVENFESSTELNGIPYGEGCYLTTEFDAACVAENIAVILMNCLEGVVIESIKIDEDLASIIESDDFAMLIQNGFSTEQAITFMTMNPVDDEVDEILEDPLENGPVRVGEVTKVMLTSRIISIFETCCTLLTGNRKDIAENFINLD